MSDVCRSTMSTKMGEGVQRSMAALPSSDKLGRVHFVFSVQLDCLLGGGVLDQNKQNVWI